MTELTCKTDEFGTKYWFLDGELHRENGPAVENISGSKFWWLNGKCHRENGPAIECANGDKLWYLNGELHREDGPAVECADGIVAWWLNGKFIARGNRPENWNELISLFQVEQVMNL